MRDLREGMTPAETTTDRTPWQRAEFYAREVMGWTIYTDPAPGFKRWWVSADGQAKQDMSWSPWRNLTDAREVLEKLREIVPSPTVPLPTWRIHQAATNLFHVGFPGLDIVAICEGPHEGPAICELALKVMESK